MPHYDYECTRCHYVFEKFQRMSEAPLKTCPQCGGPARRLIGAGAGIIFKGSGFYHTDYRSRDYQKRAQEESSPKTPCGKDSCGSPRPCEK